MWTKPLLATSITAALLVSTSANAATQKDEEKDSVFGWGSWSASVQTAAGPGVTGAAVLPLLSDFVQTQNNINSQSFEAETEGETIVDNAGLRQYQAWYSKGAHDKPKSTERAYFTEFDFDDENNSLNYAVGTDAGDQTHNPRKANFNAKQDAFISYKNKGKTIAVVNKENWGGGLKEITQEQTHHRNQQRISINSPDESADFFYGSLAGGIQERTRTREGLKYRQDWLIQTPWSKWSNWKSNPVNNSSNFIYGQSSSINAVTQILSGAGTAVYSGGFMGQGGNVTLTLDFGNKSWSGNFNPNNSSSFDVANGTFNGVDLAGSVTTTKSIASGNVDASFFGSQAQYIGGIADVKDTEGGRFVEVFGTTNAR